MNRDKNRAVSLISRMVGACFLVLAGAFMLAAQESQPDARAGVTSGKDLSTKSVPADGRKPAGQVLPVSPDGTGDTRQPAQSTGKSPTSPQPPKPVSKPSDQSEPPTKQKKQAVRLRRDPFSTTDTMWKIAEQSNIKQSGPFKEGPNPRPAMISIPSLQLRGLADDGVQPAVALVEVQGGNVFVIRKGNTLSVPSGDSMIRFKILDISKFGVQIEVPSTGKLILIQ